MYIRSVLLWALYQEYMTSGTNCVGLCPSVLIPEEKNMMKRLLSILLALMLLAALPASLAEDAAEPAAEPAAETEAERAAETEEPVLLVTVNGDKIYSDDSYLNAVISYYNDYAANYGYDTSSAEMINTINQYSLMYD